MKPTSNVLSLLLKALSRVNFLRAPLRKVLKAAQGLQARSPARGCGKEAVRPRRAEEGGVRLGLVSAPSSLPICPPPPPPPGQRRRFRRARPPSSCVGDAPLPRSPAARKGPVGARHLFLARRPPRRVGPCPGAGGRAPRPAASPACPFPGPAPTAWTRPAASQEPSKGSEAPPRLPALGARRAAGTCAGPRRPPCATPGAACGRGSRGGSPLSWGCLPFGRDGWRPGGPDATPLLVRPLCPAVVPGQRLGTALRSCARALAPVGAAGGRPASPRARPGAWSRGSPGPLRS